jgi:hypothetical protein
MKTLKDMELWDNYGEGEAIKKKSLKNGTCPTIDIQELRQEAIIWIKSISIGNFSMEGRFRSPTDEEKRIVKEGVVDWIKYFFNITDEEL